MLRTLSSGRSRHPGVATTWGRAGQGRAGQGEQADLLSIPGQALDVLQEVDSAHVGCVGARLVLPGHLGRPRGGLGSATSICTAAHKMER